VETRRKEKNRKRRKVLGKKKSEIGVDGELSLTNWIVKCKCGIKIDLKKANWCSHRPTFTKLCPKGHCICHLLDESEKFRPATNEEREYGFGFMLREGYGGKKE